MAHLATLLLAGLGLAAGCGGGGGDTTKIIDAGETGGGGGGGGIVSPDASTDAAVGGIAVPDAAAGGAVVDAAAPDLGVPACPPGSGFGHIAAPVALTDGEKGNHSPRAVWIGSEFAAVWLSMAEGSLGNVKFQRFNTAGAAVGGEQVLGLAKTPRFDVAWNGGGYVVAFLGAKDAEGNGYEGVRVASLGADGTPLDVAQDFPDTFDVERLALAFAPEGGGMLVYSKGRNGADGIYAQPLDEGGLKLGAPQHIAAEPANNPAVAYGNGSWGVAYTKPTGAMPNELVFRLLDERAVPIPNGQAPLQPDSAARGAVYLVYGSQDTFGLAWTHVDEAGGTKPKLTLLSATDASVQAQPDVDGPEGFGIVTDLAWHDPDFFGVAWQDNQTGSQRVGITRINPVGVAQPPFVLEPPAGMTAGGLSAAGTVSNLGAFYTLDVASGAAGISESAEVYLSRLGACMR